MKRDDLTQLFAYALVSVLAVLLAFGISMKWLKKSTAQAPPVQAPAQGAIPPPGNPTPENVPPPINPPPGGQVTNQVGVPPPPPLPPPPGQLEENTKTTIDTVRGFLEPFIYESKGRRDPFQPYVEFRQDKGTPTEATPSLPLTELQKFDLEDLKLVAILWDNYNPKAMFLDPQKNVHYAGRDESIGKRNGYVATIREGEVVVVEQIHTANGTSFKPVVLRLDR